MLRRVLQGMAGKRRSGQLLGAGMICVFILMVHSSRSRQAQVEAPREEFLCRHPILSRNTQDLLSILERAESGLELTKPIDPFVSTTLRPQGPWGHFNQMGRTFDPCHTVRSFGAGDEEKRFCVDAELMSDSSCVVFSVGSNNEYQFELDMAKDTPCAIYTFDCTVDEFRPPTQLAGRGKQFKFCIGKSGVLTGNLYQDGSVVAAADSKRSPHSFKNLHELMVIAKVNTIQFYKMDVEGAEWVVLREILDSARHTLQTTGKDIYPEQIAVEIHISFTGFPLTYCMAWSLLHEGGYVLASRRDNKNCDSCTEALFVRVRCINDVPAPKPGICAGQF